MRVARIGQPATAFRGGGLSPFRASISDAVNLPERLLVDLADLGLDPIDNIEGMTWGPRLPSGERTLILVSDNNFAGQQVTQIVALAL